MSLDKVFDIAIIGAGPGGIASTIEAKLKGIDKVIVLEKADNHSDMIRKFYKPGKRVDKDWQGKKFEFEGNVTFEECSKEEYLEQMEKKIQDAGVADKFKYNHHVYGVEKNGDGIFEIGADHELGVIQAKKVIVAIGRMGKPNKPAYKFPPKIRKRLNFNLDKVQPGEKVLVVGGGDTAGEYAYGLVDMDIGCDVTLNYRRPEIIRMNPTNKEIVERYIKEGKIHSRLGVDIENVEAVEVDGDYKVKVNYKDGTSEIFDRVVYALGGTSPVDFLKNCGINLNEWGEPEYNEETMETNVEGLYTIGDVVTSQGSIALAFNHAYRAINDIAKKL
ncbi:NAD(P)-binding domain-containing protein [Caminibacter pacificus]|uniref:Cbb3-type cytochrome oxidase assembly protein CcoS n=1 Tax=Caminibacter pacificus TaxID=1424653 RepID=A0AAJ4RDR2_9BACT|nr:NAD(P)-binding domain-containing protein [Caminibacter pacificus]QCI28530.1 cbb3-type cytochrome oxidase assembly protein CcoS [Caminibacter pacificus]ROR40743.1 thioredoxin reductase (NADPH) [Caminibacter pacificus]